MEIKKVLKHFSQKKSKLKNSNAILKHVVSRIIFCCIKTINLSILLLYHILTKKSLCMMSVYEHWSDFGREKIEHSSRKNGALKRKRTFKWGTKSIKYKSLPRKLKGLKKCGHTWHASAQTEQTDSQITLSLKAAYDLYGQPGNKDTCVRKFN